MLRPNCDDLWTGRSRSRTDRCAHGSIPQSCHAYCFGAPEMLGSSVRTPAMCAQRVIRYRKGDFIGPHITDLLDGACYQGLRCRVPEEFRRGDRTQSSDGPHNSATYPIAALAAALTSIRRASRPAPIFKPKRGLACVFLQCHKAVRRPSTQWLVAAPPAAPGRRGSQPSCVDEKYHLSTPAAGTCS